LKQIIVISFLLSGFFAAGAQNRIGNESSNHFIRFYPNPATAVINFDYQKGYDMSHTFTIYNFMGKKVFETKNTTARFSVDLENFYRGIYVFQLRNKNGQLIESGKFQVVK